MPGHGRAVAPLRSDERTLGASLDLGEDSHASAVVLIVPGRLHTEGRLDTKRVHRALPTGTRNMGMARLAVLCTVLFGLLLMHGGPATAVGGCHDLMSASAPMGTASAMTVRGTVHPEASARAAVMRADATMGGSLCVSALPRDGVLLPVQSQLGMLVLGGCVPLGPGWAGALRDTRRRGPPRAGRNLLLQVCVART